MEQNSSQKQPLKSQKYYPKCINEQKTNQRIAIQRSISKKILDFASRRKKIPADVVHKISSYVFSSPLVLQEQIYSIVQKSQIDYGTFLFYNKSCQTGFKIEVKKFWRKLDKDQMTVDNVMRFSIHFDGCMELKSYLLNLICDQRQDSEDKCKIVSENNNYFYSLFKIINKYKKDGIISQYVIKAFSQLMSRFIALIVVNNSQRFLIIDHFTRHYDDHDQQSSQQIDRNIAFQIRQGKQKVKIGIGVQNNKLKILSNKYKVYIMVQKIRKRNEQTFLNPFNLKQITINDVFINI